jgi:glutathione S-transferase
MVRKHHLPWMLSVEKTTALCHVARGEAQNKAAFVSVMNEVESELGAAGGPFFLGADLSLVDITFVPFVERLVASLQYYSASQVLFGLQV